MKYIFSLLFFVVACLQGSRCFAQGLLSKAVSVDVRKKPVRQVLKSIEASGHFSFSYNSAIVPGDSVVTISARNKPVREVLRLMFGERYQYKEIDNHIIIVVAEKEKWFTISGTVVDAVTQAPVSDASVFERQELASTFTDREGRFRLRIKDKGRYPEAYIVISMGTFYNDTVVTTLWGFDRDLTIVLDPATNTLPDVAITAGMERSWLGQFLLSSKLRQQSANLSKFFVNKPVQASFLPGIGTHGKMSGQVTDKFSFNILGGYTAGVRGVELGGLFNIDKKDVGYVQVAGVFNIVNGSASGVQVGGVANKVYRSVNGLQVSGVTSITGGSARGMVIAGVVSQLGGKMQGMQVSGVVNLLTGTDTAAKGIDTARHMEGFQLAGVANVANGDCRGMQLAGISNVANGRCQGMQLAGIVNTARGGIKGIQVSGICNITTRMDGVQVGFINIADTVTGYSIGLLNIVKKGYHNLSLSSTDLMNVDIAYRSGNRKLYSILEACANFTEGQKRYGYGLGIGTERVLGRRLSLSGEVSALTLYEGNVDETPLLLRSGILLHWNLAPKFSLFTGTSLSLIPAVHGAGEAGYSHGAPSAALYRFHTNSSTAMWIGWQVGFHIF
ncbi:MAG: STN and carboxypeptidase regulatory-like domain-containing protein [Bacteroidota bacterium]